MAVQLVTDGETAADSGHLVLSVTGLEVAYGGSAPALRGVTLEVREGHGGRAAGRQRRRQDDDHPRHLRAAASTTTGASSSGSVELDGNDVTKLRANKIVAQGVAQVPEGRMVFAELTVDENLRIGATARKGGVSQRGHGADLRAVPADRVAAATTRPAGCRAASSRWSRSAAG